MRGVLFAALQDVKFALTCGKLGHVVAALLLCAASASNVRAQTAPGSPPSQGASNAAPAPTFTAPTFTANWVITTKLHGDAPLFANERSQVLHALRDWATRQGARLMPADAFDRLPPNHCAASSVVHAPLDVTYPQVDELSAMAMCGPKECTLTVWLVAANKPSETAKSNTSTIEALNEHLAHWATTVPTDHAHELSAWLSAIANLRADSTVYGGLLASLYKENASPLTISDVSVYGTTSPAYVEDFRAMEQSLQRCYVAKGNGGANGESLLLSMLANGEISGCEADVDVSLGSTSARERCLCEAATRSAMPKALSTTGRARVRLELFNRALSTGPSVEFTEKNASPNFVTGVNSSFSQFVGSLQTCFSQHAVPMPDERRLRLSVSGSGHLQSASLDGGTAQPALTQCLTQAIQQARFPCTEDNQPATFEATVRTSARETRKPNRP